MVGLSCNQLHGNSIFLPMCIKLLDKLDIKQQQCWKVIQLLFCTMAIVFEAINLTINCRWLLAFKDAFGFRTSHYFVCFTASAIMLLGGYPLSQTSITKPLEIEVPRSLVQVVVNWNMPMHNWLKTCKWKNIYLHLKEKIESMENLT